MFYHSLLYVDNQKSYFIFSIREKRSTWNELANLDIAHTTITCPFLPSCLAKFQSFVLMIYKDKCPWVYTCTLVFMKVTMQIKEPRTVKSRVQSSITARRLSTTLASSDFAVSRTLLTSFDSSRSRVHDHHLRVATWTQNATRSAECSNSVKFSWWFVRLPRQRSQRVQAHKSSTH